MPILQSSRHRPVLSALPDGLPSLLRAAGGICEAVEAASGGAAHDDRAFAGDAAEERYPGLSERDERGNPLNDSERNAWRNGERMSFE
jgi:hypothetical protein